MGVATTQAPWLMFSKPATKAFMAGHPAGSGPTWLSALQPVCSCTLRKTGSSSGIGVGFRYETPPGFRSSISCSGSHEQNYSSLASLDIRAQAV